MKLNGRRKRFDSGSLTLQKTRVFIFPCALLLCCAGHTATLYVNPSHPRAQDHGQGDESRPYRSISYALENLRSGDRLLIMEGIYRETVDLKPVRFSDGGRPAIIEGAPGAKVVIKGSDVVTGWEPQPNGVFVKRNWPHNSQQVFVEGVALKQIGGKLSNAFSHPKVDVWPGRISGDQNDLIADSFYYDADEKSLYIKPADGALLDKTVEVSVRRYLIFSDAKNNYTLRNLSATHSNATAIGRTPAVRLGGNNITVENLRVTWTDGTGIGLIGDNNTIKDSVSSFNGQLGIAGKGRNVKMIGNETHHNNVRGFNKFWEAGGIKCIGPGGSSPSGLLDSVIERHKAFYNNGGGIWLDSDNRNVVIRDSEVAYNDGDGIHYEISYSGTIVGNYVFGNRLRGIYLSNAVATVVEHNVVIANDLDGIAVNNERSSDPKYAAVNNKIIGNIIAWNGKMELRLPPKNIPSVSNENLFVGAQAPRFGVWHKPAYPRVSGLSSWTEMSGQDKNSWQTLMPFPPALELKIKRRETDLDWPLLTSITRQLDIAAAAKRPGPHK
jgi:parallel beta-helix repeat protein